jgi:hypothetical protein
MCNINCSGGCPECAPEEHLAEAIKLIRRRLDKELGDCEVFWNFDAREFLDNFPKPLKKPITSG